MSFDSNQTKIKIDSDEKMKDLIKFYFNILNRPDLYGCQHIFFKCNNVDIKPDSEDPIKKYITGQNNEITILVINNKNN